MLTSSNDPTGVVQHCVTVEPTPLGQFTAQFVGLPELRATAETREESLRQVGAKFGEWVASGQMVSIGVPNSNPLLSFTGHADPNDPLEQEFVEELARRRRKDLELRAARG